MRKLFHHRRKWRFTVTFGAITALVLMLFIHALITTVSIYPDQNTLNLINSILVFELVNNTTFWNAQAFFLSAPAAAGQFWWQPFWFGAIAGLVIILWAVTLTSRVNTAIAVWLLVLLSVTTLVSLNNAASMLAELVGNPNLALDSSQATAQAIALYLATGAFVISLGRWRR
ncbi:hypothetical protein [Aliidiomarina quisquiliarum]|uniref:hypothetical protein n=1 Tax=Aliidiomarina quisquiliarum TaxID=2938947 RepID=UPI00208E3013|nr:hypothetical protein [Aliidiomarina quisquiliarum]MCO4321069.1 hypothetical protein [Aliidiomarina quisquiliarum]